MGGAGGGGRGAGKGYLQGNSEKLCRLRQRVGRSGVTYCIILDCCIDGRNIDWSMTVYNLIKLLTPLKKTKLSKHRG